MDPPHMAGKKQDDQLEHTFSNYVRIQDVALKTYQRRWTIGRSGERGSGIFMLAARHDDDDDDDCYTSYEMTDQFLWFQVQMNSCSSNWNTHLQKPDCHSWWISKMQSGREDTLKERYAIKFRFKLGKNATETYGMLQTAFQPSYMNRQSVSEWHMRFKEGRESVRDDERCGRSKEVNTPELIGQRFRVRVTMLRF